MPPAPVDPGRLLDLGAALAPWRDCTGAGAQDVLAHFVEVGDRATQSALDDYLDVVADLLRVIEAATGDLDAQLQAAAGGHAPGSEGGVLGPTIEPRRAAR